LFLKNDTLRDNYIIIFEVHIDNSQINWNYREFENIIFQEKVIIKDAEINSGLSFVNCEFKKGIIFQNVKSTNYDTTINSKNSSILFSHCNSSIVVFVNNCFFERSIQIQDNCQFEKIELHLIKIVNEGLNIKDSSIDYVDISNSELDVTLSNSTFFKPLRLESSSGSISLISNEFKGWLKFWNIECKSSFTLNNNKFEDTFDIEGSRINGLFIHGDTFDKKATLENRDVTGNNKEAFLNEIYITEAKFMEGFYCNGLGKSIEKITLPLTPSFQGVLKFEGWEANNVYISGVNQNLKLLFKRMFFGFFVINDFTNYSDISFDKCKGDKESTFNLLDSDLGTTKFNEFEFNSFGAIRIDNATLDKIKPTSNNWFEDELLQVGNGTQTKQEEFKSKREIYRQIKQALKNNGNQIDSLIFQAKELSAFRGELKNSKKYNWADRIVMSVSRSNDYGLNWEKPVWIVLGFTLLFYLILFPYLSDKIVYSISFKIEDCENTWNAFLSNLNVFWQLFNPIRQMKITYGDNVNSGWIYFIDLLHRIFLGIMIFQIIKAFRKHVSS